MTLSHNKNHWNVFWLTTRNLRAVLSSQVTVSLVSTFSFDKSRYIKLCFYLICSTCIRWNQVQMICYFEKQSMFFVEVENSENRILICTKLWSGKAGPFSCVRKSTARSLGPFKVPSGSRARLVDFSRFDDILNSFSEPTVYWYSFVFFFLI